jgi:hypothetical protein
MPLTENELRDLLHQRSAAAPAAPDRVGAVRTRVAKQRRRELAAVSGALALVVVAGALWAVPRNSAKPVDPASPSPSASPSSTGSVSGTVTTTADVGGLSTVVTGPQAVDGDAPFDVTLKATNISSSRWKGTLAAGLASTAEAPGMFEGGLITSAEDAVPNTSNLGSTMPDETSQFDGVIPENGVTLAVGESRTWTFKVRRDLSTPVVGPVTGWVAFADREGHDGAQPVDASTASALTFTPTASNLSCATVAIGTWDRGAVNPWTLDLGYTAVVGSDRKVRWTEISGLGDQGMTVDSDQTGKVRSSTIMKALGDLGAATPSGFGAELPDRPTTLDPGRYVAYSGTRTVPITFAGTCGPSGDAISGTWTAYDNKTTGLLECSVTPDASSLGVKAKAICPKG